MSSTKIRHESFKQSGSSGRRNTSEDYQLQRSPTHGETSTKHNGQSNTERKISSLSGGSKIGDLFYFHGSSDEDDNLSSNTKPVSPQDVLKGVVAYIEVRSNTENRSEGISKQMEMLGAKISKKFTSDVTHVVFKDGKKSTKEKAIKKGVYLVSVLWLDSCKCNGKRVPEEDFPVLCGNNAENSPIIPGRLKRYKSMQPKSFEEEVKLSAEKIERKKRRLDQLKARTPTSSTFAELQDAMTRSPFVVRPSLSPRFVPCTPRDLLVTTVPTGSQESSQEKEREGSHSPGESSIQQLAKRLRFDCEYTNSCVPSVYLTKNTDNCASDISDKRCAQTGNESNSSDKKEEQKTPAETEKSRESRITETVGLKPGISPTTKTGRQRTSLEDFKAVKEIVRRTDGVAKKRKIKKILTTSSNRPNLKRKRKSPNSMVMTSMHYSDQEIVRSVVKKLGLFSIEDSVSPLTSHVIAGSGRRTLNVLKAISSGCWILSLEWVMNSLETGHWIEEEPYELSDAYPSAQLCRLEKATLGSNYHCKLLADVPCIYVGNGTSPPSDEIVNLIQVSGGQTSPSFRNASICIGRPPKKIEAIHVSEKWLLDCVTYQNVLPYEKYQTEECRRSPSPTF